MFLYTCAYLSYLQQTGYSKAKDHRTVKSELHQIMLYAQFGAAHRVIRQNRSAFVCLKELFCCRPSAARYRRARQYSPVCRTDEPCLSPIVRKCAIKESDTHSFSWDVHLPYGQQLRIPTKGESVSQSSHKNTACHRHPYLRIRYNARQ